MRPARHRSPRASVSSFLKRMNEPNCSYGRFFADILDGPPGFVRCGEDSRWRDICEKSRISSRRRGLIPIPLHLPDLHVAVVIGDVRSEGVRAVVLGDEVEKVALRGSR